MATTGKKILITGGTGFIGQHLAKKFISNKQPVTIYDIAEPTLKGLKKVYTAGDIFDTDKLEKAVNASDVVIHLVGIADAGIAERDPARSFKLNVLSLQSVLEACRKHGEKKLIFPSSATIYGEAAELPIKESSPPNPTWMYAWHKYLCELMIKAYHKRYGINYVILRLFNVYGAGHKGVIEIFLEKAKKGEVIESFGPYQYRDFVYAGDVADAMYNAAMHYKVDNRTVNIGSGRGAQIKDILNIICKLFPKAKWVEKTAKFTVYDHIADITLAKILLNFKPHDTLEFMKGIIKKEMM
jgi:UDP-glucose 4-epimerase